MLYLPRYDPAAQPARWNSAQRVRGFVRVGFIHSVGTVTAWGYLDSRESYLLNNQSRIGFGHLCARDFAFSASSPVQGGMKTCPSSLEEPGGPKGQPITHVFSEFGSTTIVDAGVVDDARISTMETAVPAWTSDVKSEM